jgi:hypothetical protein
VEDAGAHAAEADEAAEGFSQGVGERGHCGGGV